ncbi:helix-turn-helix domain-containing protein [Kitasatospora kifunensis]|uniref:Transcriptional regulator with XRE-family HTH domain n=1 Tax=Kitasatospora kifunensis TaxID=58351 RepID=A0A7W7R2S3_KITKI|nr:helix-turn-helix transcriptional regulator [Kitasatospora kifunensis]MBB4923771.1 transcriptional regulator with XRE-family HTH domain [Kitasatospora kifunensis]
MYDPARAKARRIKIGLSVRQVADRVGVSETTVYAWESGDRTPTLDHYVHLAHALRIPFDGLMRQAEGAGIVPDLLAAEWSRKRNPDVEPTIRDSDDADIRLFVDRLYGSLR